MVELALHLDPGADTPLYEQLYGALAGQIRTGRLAEGTRLPGKRSLAASLGLAVNTVDTAYQMLVAQFAQQFAHEGVHFINREDDTGDLGLRTSKLSYHPVALLEKYTVTIEEPCGQRG